MSTAIAKDNTPEEIKSYTMNFGPQHPGGAWRAAPRAGNGGRDR